MASYEPPTNIADMYLADPGDITPPGPVTNVAASSANTAIRLNWVNPTDSDFTSVVIRRALGTTPASSPTAGTAVATDVAPGNTYYDTRVSAGTVYSYALFARDAIPNYAPAATVTRRRRPNPSQRW